MAGLSAAKADLPVGIATLCNQRAPSAQVMYIFRFGSGLDDDDLRILLAPVRVKCAPHLVGFVEVIEHLNTPGLIKVSD